MSKILIIGNVVLDQIMLLPNFPQQDQEMHAIDLRTEVGGNACNSAQILSQLGNQPLLMSSLGDDSEGHEILQILNQKGINTSLCVIKHGHQTPRSHIWINQQNASRTITHFRDLPELSLSDLKHIRLSDYDWIHFEGRNIDSLRAYFETFPKSALQHSCTLSLEIEKARDDIENLLPYIDVVIVSSHYLNEKDLSAEQCIQQLQYMKPTLKIAITGGDTGVIGSDRPGNILNIPAIAVNNIIDTIGAGDCFIAAWIDALLRFESFESSLQTANNIAAYKIQHRGMNIEGYQNSNL